MIMERKKQSANQQKSLMKPSNSPNPSESSIAIEENSCGESSRSDSSFMYTKAYVQPSETLSNFLFDDEDDSTSNIRLNKTNYFQAMTFYTFLSL